MGELLEERQEGAQGEGGDRNEEDGGRENRRDSLPVSVFSLTHVIPLSFKSL